MEAIPTSPVARARIPLSVHGRELATLDLPISALRSETAPAPADPEKTLFAVTVKAVNALFCT